MYTHPHTTLNTTFLNSLLSMINQTIHIHFNFQERIEDARESESIFDLR